jgi:hypothetical protein
LSTNSTRSTLLVRGHILFAIPGFRNVLQKKGGNSSEWVNYTVELVPVGGLGPDSSQVSKAQDSMMECNVPAI